MKKLKRSKASKHKEEIDMISNLPDDVLQLILSGISSTEEVIRTSILSRRWRYLWTSIPSVDLDLNRGQGYNGFREFVYWVLLNKSVDLNGFRLRCDKYYNMSTIAWWIHAVVVRKVKVVDLMFLPIDEPVEIKLPQCLVTCGSLEVLKLCLLGCRIRLPNITGFPALRVLELKDVNLSGDNIVKYFLESCPLLEDLSLIECRANSLVISCPKLKSLRIDNRRFVNHDKAYSLKICCPKLEILKLTGDVATEFLFESLCSLKRAVLHPIELYSWEIDPFDLFARISHVESLSTRLDFILVCFDPEVDAPISLPNLKTLELTVDGFDMDALIPFLTCLPDLESLHLIFPNDIYNVDNSNIAKAATMSILTRHLKKAEFLEINGEREKLKLACDLLKHGKALEEMVFIWGAKARFHERSKETMKQVSKCQKASSTVKLTAVLNTSQAGS